MLKKLSGEVRKRDQAMIKMDRIIKEKNVVRVCIVLRKGLDNHREFDQNEREY